MATIQFTRNHTDHSTDKGYQFEFFCDRCGNGFMSEFQTSVAGLATGAVRTIGNMFGGIFGQAGAGTFEIDSIVRGPAHDKALREAIEQIKPNFRQCPKCAKWACGATCWNPKRSLCYDCAPDEEVELASAQAQITADQIREKLQQSDLTRKLDLKKEGVALCPSCGAHTQGAKFCPECGESLRPKSTCPSCGHEAEAGTKFCPECGKKLP